MKKIILLLSIILLITACSKKSETGQSEPDYTDSLVISYAGEEGKTAFELLEQHHEVTSESSSMGVFVKAIDSVAIGNGYYWLISVNDTMAMSAADKIMTKSTDSIRWHFRKSF